ncbi:MAG: hypothetical protein J1E16_05535 [Muribaculaceae bacterium]|nr:hypothetical protein [Muribaculaceae bacterium]
MFEINFSDRIIELAPTLKILQIEAEVSNPDTPDSLWSRIESASKILKEKYELSDINKRASILGTRKIYKLLGKDPNRYRPSAEALCRRIINGKGIYRLTTLIDIINLISIETGYSIGGFDANKIEGNKLILDAGSKEDNFNAIGRGQLNIEGLPVYRDEKGGIGTPTSDEERTKLTPDTTKLLMLVNIYQEETSPQEVEAMAKELLSRYANLTSFSSKLIKV